MIRKCLRDIFFDFHYVPERICILRLRIKCFNFWLACFHAPTEDNKCKHKYILYGISQNEFDKIPRHDVKFAVADFNPKSGKEHTFMWKISNFNLHEMKSDEMIKLFSENGIRAIDLSASNNLVIYSTCFEHKNIHKET